jgi:DNA-binding CsgD family transcriptional regulator
VLILSTTRQSLYITPNAHKFLAELGDSNDASWNSAALPLAIQHVCNELQHDGTHDPSGTDWDKMHVRHLARTAHGTILVRGYGMLEKGTQAGRFLLLFEMVSLESSAASDTGDERDYQFTERQRAIVNGLVLGLTNKAIAESLFISVHTVKEYIRQLMMKLHTDSRTGIVARVAGLTLPSTKKSDHRTSSAVPNTVQVA